jgi:hypothetical protein
LWVETDLTEEGEPFQVMCVGDYLLREPVVVVAKDVDEGLPGSARYVLLVAVVDIENVCL